MTITSPLDGYDALPTGVELIATATDAEDNDVALADTISWISDVDDPLGTGPSFSAVLTPCTHTVSASATDSNGNVVTEIIFVEISISLLTHTISDQGSCQTLGFAWITDGICFSSNPNIPFNILIVDSNVELILDNGGSPILDAFFSIENHGHLVINDAMLYSQNLINHPSGAVTIKDGSLILRDGYAANYGTFFTGDPQNPQPGIQELVISGVFNNFGILDDEFANIQNTDTSFEDDEGTEIFFFPNFIFLQKKNCKYCNR